MENYPKTYATAKLEITCPDEWTNAQDFARENRDQSLMNCITRLLSWRSVYNDVKIVVFKDGFIDNSFYFAQIYPNGKTGIEGGIIYHGKPAVKDGFGYKYGWQIHT